MTNTTDSTQANTVTCAGCGLLCDDVTLSADSTIELKNGCAKGVTFFEQAFSTQNTPSIAGKPCDLESAISAAANILNNSKSPLFAGLGTEVLGMRATMRLAEQCNATLDHMHSESTIRNTLTMQNGGWLTTTLAEVKNRADVILAIGTDVSSSHPRFFERLVWNKDSLFDKPEPEVIYLGVPAERAKAAVSPQGKQPTVITANTSQIPELINTINALLKNKKISMSQIAGVEISTLIALVEKLKNAKYAVVVWSAGSLKISHAELTVQSIVEMINQLNESTRAAGLPLNSGDGDSSVNNTSTWLSGYPTRNRYVANKPEYDSYHFSSTKALKQSDALLWISTFNPHLPPDSSVPTVVIGHAATQFSKAPDVFIPVGTPGVDHAGLMFRVDSSITLPLKKVRNSELPSLNDVIQKIEAKLQNNSVKS